MPDLPCTPEAGVENDPASADVAGHGHRFRLGVDQSGYLRLLRCFDSFARAVLHASETRRAASYESHPTLVSSQLSETTAGEADPRPSRQPPGPRRWPSSGSESLPRMPWKTVQRCPRGMCRPACHSGVSAAPCIDAEEPLDWKSTGRKNPIVPRRVRLFQNVSEPSDAVASEAAKYPRNVSAGRPCCLARHLAAGRSSAGSDSVSKALGQPPWSSMA